MKIEIGYAPKTVELKDKSKLHFWYSNNPGRETNNCTIIRSFAPRANVSAKQKDVLAKVNTASFKGKINFSKAVQAELGLTILILDEWTYINFQQYKSEAAARERLKGRKIVYVDAITPEEMACFKRVCNGTKIPLPGSFYRGIEDSSEKDK